MKSRALLLVVFAFALVGGAKKDRLNSIKGGAEVLVAPKKATAVEPSRQPCEDGTHLYNGLCVKNGNKTHAIDPRFAFLPKESPVISLKESYVWDAKFRTNISSLSPAEFQDPQFEIMSVRQLEFEDSNRQSKRYHSGFATTIFVPLHAAPLRPPLEFPGNCIMKPQDIAAYCDWALLLPCFYGNVSVPPRTVFVHHLMLPFFVDNVLPNIPRNYKFVLVTSGTDQTIPRSSGDVRFHPLRGFTNTTDGGPNWKLLTTHRQIIHWYCENHDLNHPKVSTLPVGVVDGLYGMEHIRILEPIVPIDNRTVQFLVAHRVRTGKGQWELRQRVSDMCHEQQVEHLPSHVLCVTPPATIARDHRKGITQGQYVELAQNMSFILCVRGGGIDPSPKAWEAIMMGTIPIIQHSTLDDAYSLLPVVFIDDWARLFGSVSKVRARLEELRSNLSPYYTNPNLRAKVVERLKMTFWVDRIHHTYNVGHPRKNRVLALSF